MVTDDLDSDRVRSLVGFLFEDDQSLVSTKELLRERPDAIVTDGSCPECDGVLYEWRHDVICSDCSLVIEEHREESESAWVHFWETRGTYNTSGQYRCIGGYPHVHEWGDSSDSPEEFYR